MRRPALAASLLVLLSLQAAAQTPHAGVEWRAATPDLGAIIVLTQNPEKAARTFDRTPPGGFVEMESAQEVHYGESIAALVFFTGCSSACKVFVDYELTGPDGSVRRKVVDKEGTEEASPRKKGKTLSRALVRFSFDAKDPVGTYRIIAKVREPALKASVQVSERFDVKP